ncbi:MAG: carboxypeptidase regulatory-like domain-containing protein [Kofleriaceae bacterium]
MNRKVLGGVVALLVVIVGIWFFAFRGRGDDTEVVADTGSGRTGSAALPQPAKTEDGKPAPRGQAPRWSLDVDPEGPLRLEGQVQGPDGKGVGGADVWLASVPPRATKTDDDGSFSFDKLVGRSYVLSAATADLISGQVTYKLTGKGDPVVIRLVEGATVTVTVTSETKQPISGAEVMLADASHRTATTDAKGIATLRPVRPGWANLQAQAPGYAPNTGFATVGSAGGTGRAAIILRKGFPITGQVVDEAGKPIAKARVYASGGAWDDWTGTGDADAPRGEVTSDAKGAFTIPALANGAHTLTAVDGEHAPGSAPVQVNEMAVTGVTITMKTGGVIAGVVLDAQQKPAPFATVRVAGTGAQMWNTAARQATTDESGAFEVRGLARAKLQARAESEDAASELEDVDLTREPSKKGIKLVLGVTGAISGIVVDDTGKPVPEVQVNAFPDIMGGASTEGLALAGMSSATSDGAGRFTIHGVPEGAYRLWAARVTGGQDWGQQGTSAKTGDKGVRITLAAPGGLVGKVELDGGSVPKLVNVQIGYQAPVQAQAGAFTIKDLTPGAYAVTFRGPEFAEMVKHDIKIEPGKVTDLGTVKVFRGRRLSGTVVDSGGKPIAGAKVKLAEMLFSAQGNEDQAESFEDLAGVKSAISDGDGAFTIIGVPKKATTAMADHAKGRSVGVPIPEGTEDPPPVTLTLRGFGSIVGKVTMKGQPQDGVTISESTKGGGAQAQFGKTDDAGNFTLAKVTEGTHVLQAMQTKMMSMKSTTVTVNVTAGAPTRVTIEIPVGQITLAVNIKALASNKVDAAQVFLFAGAIAPQNAKQLTDNFFQGGAAGMKFWFGEGKPAPEFEEVVPGDYSVCTIPITGNMMDPAFQQKLQANMQLLKVYCKQVKVLAAPLKQAVEHVVPAMDPLPS